MTACEEKIYNDVDSTLFRCALHCIIVHLSGTDFNDIADIIYKDFAISYMSCIKHIPGSISLRNWPLKHPWITSLKNESNTRNQTYRFKYIKFFKKLRYHPQFRLYGHFKDIHKSQLQYQRSRAAFKSSSSVAYIQT